MASSLLISPLRSRLPLFIGLGTFTAATLLLPNRPRINYLDSTTSASLNPKDWTYSQYQHDAQTPVLKRQGGLNPKAIRQISLGSILGTSFYALHVSRNPYMYGTWICRRELTLYPQTGVAAGLAVSVFSKPLTLLIGLLVLGVQAAESRGIHLVPYNRIQGYFKNTNIRSAIQDNVALKLSFGATFAMVGFLGFTDYA